MTVRILAIDIGLSLGYCYLTPDSIKSGVLQFEKHDPSAHPGRRWYHISKSLEQMIYGLRFEEGLDLIVYEDIQRPAARCARIAYPMIALVQKLAFLSDVACLKCYPKELKKWASGKGDASKTQMLASAAVEWPLWQPQTDDEVDARLLALWAQREVKGTSDNE